MVLEKTVNVQSLSTIFGSPLDFEKIRLHLPAGHLLASRKVQPVLWMEVILYLRFPWCLLLSFLQCYHILFVCLFFRHFSGTENKKYQSVDKVWHDIFYFVLCFLFL